VQDVERSAAPAPRGGQGRRLPGQRQHTRPRVQRRPGVGDPLPGRRHPRRTGGAVIGAGSGGALIMGDAAALTWRSFHVPKQGHTAAEYEDGWAAAPESGRFAIADGASESAFAGAWARTLVDAAVQMPG